MPPLRGTGFTEHDGDAAREARLASVPRTGRDQLADLRRTGRAALYHGFCTRGGCHVNAKGSTAVTTIPKAQATKRLARRHRGARHQRSTSTSNGRVSGVDYVKGGDRVLPAGRRRAAGQLHLRERAAAAALEVEGVPERARRTTTARSAGTTSATTPARRVTALFPLDLNNWYGLPAQGVAVDNWADDNFDHAGLDFIGGGNLWVYSDRRPIARRQHEHVRQGAALGLGVEGVHQAERRPLEHRLPAEDDAAVRGQLPRSRSRR